MKHLLIILLAFSLTLVAAEKKQNDEIDHLALAALLMKDGFYDRAKEELNQVDLEDEKLDKGRFYTLEGLVQMKSGNYKASNEAFGKALAFEDVDRALYLYIAQNAYKLQDYQGALEAIAQVRDLANEKASVLALEAECHWRLKQQDDAMRVLAEGIKRFPKEWNFYKQRFNYLVSLQLYQSALLDAQVYLANAKPNEKTVLSFIAALRNSGDTAKAIELAEEANIRFIQSAEVTVMLAHLYLDKEMIQAAADLFDEASIEDDKYTKEAAEMMRRAKEFVTALYKNSQMLDNKEKLKQRVAIFIEFGAYERIIASRAALERSELIEDETIRYALAFAYYMSMEFDASEAQLKQLTRPDLFSKATELRKNMQKCIDDHWECEL